MKILNKQKLNEVVDTHGDLIGADAVPHTGSNIETAANGTTDDNVKIGTQPFRYDMLGRFGFTMMPFYESVGDNDRLGLVNIIGKFVYENNLNMLKYYHKYPNKLQPDFRKKSKVKFESLNDEDAEELIPMVNKLLNDISPYLNKQVKNIEEAKVVEDKILLNRIDNEFKKKDENKNSDVLDSKIKKVADLINKMNIDNKNKLIDLLEKKNG